MRPEEITPEALKARAICGGPRVCWPWQAHITKDGYGVIDVNFPDGTRTTTTAHRAMWVALYGPVSADHEVHHTCRTRHCINPGHLDALSTADHGRAHRRGPDHGRLAEYVAGCRCDECRDVWNAYGRAHWARNADHINARRRAKAAAKRAERAA